MRQRARGLTLVELLVTIVLVALTVSLVVGGIGQGSALLARVATDQGEAYHELMARAWLRQTIAAAAPPLAGQSGIQGGAQELRLSTLRPLLGPEGIATNVVWRATTNGDLVYTEGDQTVQLDALPALARFEYQGSDLAWHSEWPAEDQQGLRERVRLVFEDADDRLDVAPLARHTEAAGTDDEEASDEE
jgi:hypothetical protein